MKMVTEIKVLELFSGIGGMHTAMIESGLPFSRVGSFEINPTALQIYRHNYPNCVQFKEQNIMGLKVKDFDRLDADLILMSPPCQPFTRQGLQKDIKDSRCSPLLHILSLLKDAQNVPDKILLENVAGFETSAARDQLIDLLEKKNFVYQEFLISPTDIGIPNSRLRYYILAKKNSKPFLFPIQRQIYTTSLPVCLCIDSNEKENCSQDSSMLICSNCHQNIISGVRRIVNKNFAHFSPTPEKEKILNLRLSLKNFLPPIDDPTPYLVTQKALKYVKVFDIINYNSLGSCCFTKGYGHYAQGTGSIIQENSSIEFSDVYSEAQKLDFDHPNYSSLFSDLKLRYFSPKEMLSLMSFPNYFSIPDNCSIRQAFKAIGNSINVFIVTILVKMLCED